MTITITTKSQTTIPQKQTTPTTIKGTTQKTTTALTRTRTISKTATHNNEINNQGHGQERRPRRRRR